MRLCLSSSYVILALLLSLRKVFLAQSFAAIPRTASSAPPDRSSPVLLQRRSCAYSLDFLSRRFRAKTLLAGAAKSTIMQPSDVTSTKFRGKTVLLTGASGGLGKALALQLSGCQVQTLLLSARNREPLDDISRDCQQVNPNGKVHILTCDLANPESVAKLADDALQIAPVIDVLINNGGVSSRSRFVDTSHDVDRQVMQVNFLSGAFLAKAVVPGMLQQSRGGRIVWISSVQGLVGIPNRSSYAASKFAVQGYCESIRAELASSGISVHCVSPGYIRTNLSNSALTGDGQKYGKMDPTTDAGADPNDVAAIVLQKVAKGEVDFVVAATLSATAAIWLRLLCPGLLRYSLVKRYEKSQKQKTD